MKLGQIYFDLKAMMTSRREGRLLGLVLASTAILISCGVSIFSGVENKDPAIEATVLLEKDQPAEAISILEAALKKDPTNYTLISILGSAQAQLVGVNFMTVALKMAANDSSDSALAESSSDGEGNDITFLFGALPEATADNITGLDTALTTLESIPLTERVSADSYKLTIFYTSRLALRTKKFDKNGDGLVSPVELLDLQDDDAAVILESLLSASDALDSAGIGGASAEQVAKIQEEIDAQEGDTQAEKLRNYLGSSG